MQRITRAVLSTIIYICPERSLLMKNGATLDICSCSEYKHFEFDAKRTNVPTFLGNHNISVQ